MGGLEEPPGEPADSPDVISLSGGVREGTVGKSEAAAAPDTPMGNPGGGGGRREGGISPKGVRANRGEEAIRRRSSSDSWRRLDLALRFWNHILTCVSVSFKLVENSARSAIDKYCFCWNFFSNSISCLVENGVLGFLLGLCFRKWHFSGPSGSLGISETVRVRKSVSMPFRGNKKEF